VLAVPRFGARRSILRRFRAHIDLEGHASRYLNGTLDPPVREELGPSVREAPVAAADATPQRIGVR